MWPNYSFCWYPYEDAEDREPAVYCSRSRTYIFGFATLDDAAKRAGELNRDSRN